MTSSSPEKVLGFLRRAFQRVAMVATLGSNATCLHSQGASTKPHPEIDECAAQGKLKFRFGDASVLPTLFDNTTAPVFDGNENGLPAKWYRLIGREKRLMADPANREKLDAFVAELEPYRHKSIKEKSEAINTLVNNKVQYTADTVLYPSKEGDYWASFAEMQRHLNVSHEYGADILLAMIGGASPANENSSDDGKLRGDCEDQAQFKRRLALRLDVPEDKVLLSFVRDKTAPPYVAEENVEPSPVRDFLVKIGLASAPKQQVGHHMVALTDVNEDKVKPPHVMISDNGKDGVLYDDSVDPYHYYFVFTSTGVLKTDKAGGWGDIKPRAAVCVKDPNPSLPKSDAWPLRVKAVADRPVADGPDCVSANAHIIDNFDSKFGGFVDSWDEMNGRQAVLARGNAEAYTKWLSQFDSLRGMEAEKIAKAVDETIDQNFKHEPGRENYISSPIETVTSGKGDARALASLKYDILRYLDVPAHSLHVMVAQETAALRVDNNNQQFFFNGAAQEFSSTALKILIANETGICLTTNPMRVEIEHSKKGGLESFAEAAGRSCAPPSSIMQRSASSGAGRSPFK